MFGGAKALTFVSECVDVVQLETPEGEEAYRLRCRPCQEECYEYEHCPDWIRAMHSVGDWAYNAEPFSYEELGDDENRVEEFVFRRLVLTAVQAVPLQPTNHWAWEFGDLNVGVRKAIDYVEMGLAMGEKVIVMAGPLCIEVLQGHLPVSNDIFYFDAYQLLDMVDRDEFDWKSFNQLGGTQVVRALVQQGHSVRLWAGHLPLFLGEGRVTAAMKVETYLNQLIDELGLVCACAIPSATPNLESAYRRLCQLHARMTVCASSSV